MEASNKLIHALNKYLADFVVAEPKKMAELSGAVWADPNIVVPFLNKTITVNSKTGEMNPEPPGILERILILKYLLEAQGMTPPTVDDEYIAFRQLTYGSHHQEAFRLEVTEPLRDAFGRDLPLFAKVAESFGGIKSSGGDMAYTISYFPKISLRIIIWEADDEFPAQSACLFDKKSQFHLDTDGLNELANSLTAILLKEANK
ncbi:MAG: DUF3786 domain-containing protein [Clostridiales bacterium]